MIENIKAQMRKGILECCILSIIAKKPIYASEILEILKSNQILVVEGTLYPLLTRLKNAKMLKYKWVESSQGPPRKYYTITTKGKKLLVELKNSWEELNQSITTIINP